MKTGFVSLFVLACSSSTPAQAQTTHRNISETVEPFNTPPYSCSGAALTEGEAAAKFRPGATSAIFGVFASHVWKRSCSVTECGNWKEDTTHGSLSGVIELNALSGGVGLTLVSEPAEQDPRCPVTPCAPVDGQVPYSCQPYLAPSSGSCAPYAWGTEYDIPDGFGPLAGLLTENCMLLESAPAQVVTQKGPHGKVLNWNEYLAYIVEP